MNHLTRRTFLRGSLIGGSSLLTFNQLFGYNKVFGQTDGDDAQTILNLAATAEMFATTHYYQVLTDSSIALDAGEVEILMGFLDAELQHLEYLFANNAVPLATEYFLPLEVYNDREQFSLLTEQLETVFIAAYLAATRQFAALGLPLLAGTSAQVAAIEQEHLALVRGIGGRRPNNSSLARALFYNVSESSSALQPFLEGDAGYSGPIIWPGADAIRELIRDAGVIPIQPFTDTSAFATAIAQEEVAGGVCTVTSGGNYNSNLRGGPALNFAVVDRLPPGGELSVDGQATDNDGFAWWRATDGVRWVRSDIVSVVSGTCSDLPVIAS
jgi:hypothetical protein